MNDLIYPNRTIRDAPPFLSGHNFNYYDSEIVQQTDGRKMIFDISKDTEANGWQPVCYVDEYGFYIWSENFPANQQKVTDSLIQSTKSFNASDVYRELGKDFKLADNELMYRYEYGGCLSKRIGWFIVDKRKPDVILRHKQTLMS